MDWEQFLSDRLGVHRGPVEFGDDDGELRYDDDNYRRWLVHVIATLARRRRAYELHEDERQWGERAVADRALAWAHDDLALVPVGDWPVELVQRPPRPIEQTWLDAVLKFLLAAPGRVYQLAPAEQEMAARAVKKQRLIWAVPGESLQLPASAHLPHGGPYR